MSHEPYTLPDDIRAEYDADAHRDDCEHCDNARTVIAALRADLHRAQQDRNDAERLVKGLRLGCETHAETREDLRAVRAERDALLAVMRELRAAARAAKYATGI